VLAIARWRARNVSDLVGRWGKVYERGRDRGKALGVTHGRLSSDASSSQSATKVFTAGGWQVLQMITLYVESQNLVPWQQ